MCQLTRDAIVYWHGDFLERQLRRVGVQEIERISEVLADRVALFIAWKVCQLENKSVELRQLEERLHGAAGWVPFSKLVAAGMIDIIGEKACVNERGERIIEAFDEFMLQTD